MDGEDVICWWFASSYWHMINTGSKLCLSVDHASIYVSSFMNCERKRGLRQVMGSDVKWGVGISSFVPSFLSSILTPYFHSRERERERDAKKVVNNPIFEVIQRVQQTRLNTTLNKQKSLTRLSVRRAIPAYSYGVDMNMRINFS